MSSQRSMGRCPVAGSMAFKVPQAFPRRRTSAFGVDKHLSLGKILFKFHEFLY